MEQYAMSLSVARKHKLLSLFQPSKSFISVVCVETYFVVMSCSSLNLTAWIFLQAKCTTGGSFHKANIIAHQNNLWVATPPHHTCQLSPTCNEAPFPITLIVAVFMTEGLFTASIFHEKGGAGRGGGGLQWNTLCTEVCVVTAVIVEHIKSWWRNPPPYFFWKHNMTEGVVGGGIGISLSGVRGLISAVVFRVKVIWWSDYRCWLKLP